MSNRNGLLIESVRCAFVYPVTGKSFVHAIQRIFFCSFVPLFILNTASLRDTLRLGYCHQIVWRAISVNLNLPLWAPIYPAGRLKAEYQKLRSEQQAAAQSSGKRSQIDFTSSTNKSRGKEREQEREHVGTAVGRKSRFQPYGYGSGGDGKAALGKEKERSRWG
jgi:hypothetical protein